jgi:macrophage erythroblast attacher
MLNKMRGLKRKLSACADEEERLYRQLDARTAHLAELNDMHTVDDVRYQPWSRERLDRLMVDYMLRHGYSESAAAMAETKGMQDLVDMETFKSMNRIRKALENGSVTEALAWCQENKKELRKMDSDLEFKLRYQQFVELIRSQDTARKLEAIVHAKKYLLPYRDTHPDEVSAICGLLVYAPTYNLDPATGQANPSKRGMFPLQTAPNFDDNGPLHQALSICPPRYTSIYSQVRWQELADSFVASHNALLSLPSSPLLHIALNSGLSALKTPACHSNVQHSTAAGYNTGNKNTTVCPICSMELNELAKAVPYAHHSKSHVEHDLYVLPNDRVYGKARLEEYAKKSGLPESLVKDLVTGDVYPWEDLKKVFIT